MYKHTEWAHSTAHSAGHTCKRSNVRDCVEVLLHGIRENHPGRQPDVPAIAWTARVLRTSCMTWSQYLRRRDYINDPANTDMNTASHKRAGRTSSKLAGFANHQHDVTLPTPQAVIDECEWEVCVVVSERKGGKTRRRMLTLDDPLAHTRAQTLVLTVPHEQMASTHQNLSSTRSGVACPTGEGQENGVSVSIKMRWARCAAIQMQCTAIPHQLGG